MKVEERSWLPALASVRTPPFAGRVARWLAFGMAVTGVAFLCAPWRQTAQGVGRVVAYAPLDRPQFIDAPVEGRVVRFLVREGTRVRTGDLLLEIRDNDPEVLERLRQEREALLARKSAAEERMRSIEYRVEHLGESRKLAVTAASARVEMAEKRVGAAEQNVAAASAALKAAEQHLERQRSLAAHGLSSTRTVELAELDEIRARTEVDRAMAALDAAEAETAAVSTDQLRSGTDGFASIEDARAAQRAASAEVAAARLELTRVEGRLAKQERQLVKAPRAGTVLRLLANQEGELVKPGDPLLMLVPDATEYAVELWVDGNDAPLITNGRNVRLQFEGWPAVQFSGWPSVAVGTFGGTVALVDAADDGEGKFRVLVKPDGRAPWPSSAYLRQGVRANGWVLLNEVRLGYEFWRRLNGFPPVVARKEPKPAGAKGLPDQPREGAKQ